MFAREKRVHGSIVVGQHRPVCPNQVCSQVCRFFSLFGTPFSRTRSPAGHDGWSVWLFLERIPFRPPRLTSSHGQQRLPLARFGPPACYHSTGVSFSSPYQTGSSFVFLVHFFFFFLFLSLFILFLTSLILVY